MRRSPENESKITVEQAGEIRIRQTWDFLDEVIRGMREQYGPQFSVRIGDNEATVDLDLIAQAAGRLYSDRDNETLSTVYRALTRLDTALDSARGIMDITNSVTKKR
jgi:hypothetical protein